ncbi:hypothetical protein SAMN05216548_109150 [Faunimonas pinastri]|uniref:Uncharacterized protein n=1 Tax=Faunimonas pinastri TaxID=1855383 RepID=A0A1H9KBY5_9HYPH|nr:prohead protease/major capsid protein fusion protein [Faunimonas pinastri]SEQ96619.1 hypothetical protein SAMN05216548_109150 [Faunimonas pinastri]
MTDLVTRRAALSASSFDPKTRTFTAVAATETPVARMDWGSGERVNEVLVIAASAIDLTRLNSGRAPLLNLHQAYQVADQIGVIRSARIEGGALVIEAELSGRDDVKPIADDLAAGVIRNVSIGYAIQARERIEGEGDGPDTVRVTRWAPAEVSLVPVGADPNAFIRSTGVTIMEPDEIEENETSPIAVRQPADRETRAERNRVAKIIELGRRGNLTNAEMENAIINGTTVEEFRAYGHDKMAEEAERSHTRPSMRPGAATFDNPDFLGRAVEDALFARMTGQVAEGPAREFMGRRFVDIGAELLKARGERVSWNSPDRIVSGMMTRGAGLNTTGDFPTILGNVMNKRLLQLFQAAESGASLIAATGTASDFRPQLEARLSSFPALEKVNEHGEIKFGSLNENGERLQIASYGKGIGVSFQVLVNDDMNAIDRSIQDIGFATAELKSKLILDALSMKLNDGKPVFHADHKNLGTGAVLAVQAAGAARLGMRKQTALDGKTALGIAPRFLLVPSELETTAEMFLAETRPAATGDVNPFAGKIQPAVEPRLTDPLAWYFFADPALYPVVKFLTLAGYGGPRLEVDQEFSKLGTSYRVTWHCGAGPVDYRGAYKNLGA